MKIEMVDLRITYCKYFRYLIKNSDIKSIDEFYYSKFNESPSSFRKCIKGTVKDITFEKVLNKLSNHFKYIVPTKEETEEIVSFFVNVYKKIYYKYDTKFTEELNQIEKWINEKNVIYPICLLYRVFINLSISTRVSYNLNKFKDDMSEIRRMELVYDGIFKEIFDLLELSFKKEIPEQVFTKEYNNDLMYYLLSSKSVLTGDYVRTKYSIEIAKKRFLETSNVKRIIAINLIQMLCYNIVEHYDECIKLAEEQLCALGSISNINEENVRDVTILNLVIAYTGLKEYDKALKMLETKTKLEKNEVAIYVICRYRLGLNVEGLIVSNNSRGKQIDELISIIINVLAKKESINILKKINLNPSILKLLSL